MRQVEMSLWRRSAEALCVSLGLLLPILFTGIQIGQHYANPPAIVREVVPPGRWEGQGAITLQCLWDQPYERLAQDGEKPRDAFLLMTPESDWAGNTAVGAFATSDGHVREISGSQCAWSVDWGALPAVQR